MRRLILPLALAAILLASTIQLLQPPPACAQGPDNYCVSIDGQVVMTDTVNLSFDQVWSEFIINDLAAHNAIQTPGDGETVVSCAVSPLGTWDSSERVARSVDCEHSGDSNTLSVRSFDIVISSPITGTKTKYRRYPWTASDNATGAWLYCRNGQTGAWQQLPQAGATYDSIPNGVTCDGIALINAQMADSRWHSGLDVVCGDGDYPDITGFCPLLDNPTFTGIAGWTFDGGAGESNGRLLLNPGGFAYQDVDFLTPNITYTAIISVTTAENPTLLDVSLGDQTQTLNIGTAAATYTATFTTPSVLTDSLRYELRHADDPGFVRIEITYTCLSPSEGGGDEGQQCIAPTNGEFDTADGWDFLRGSSYNVSGKNAFLPFNEGTDADRAIVLAADTYSMPTPSTGEYLLVEFDSQGDDQTPAVVAGRVASVTSADEASWFFDVYPQQYEYQVDIGAVSGETVEIGFANSGHDTFAAAVGDLFLDNVCIFLSDTPAQLPTPTDPDATPPVDLGFDYSCDDVDGIFASFGVNIQQYRAEYEAGASVWDPSGWVPWLVAAFWVILATYACLFVAAFVALVRVIEYVLTNGLNVADFFIRLSGATLTWLGLAWTWLLASLPNIIVWIGLAFVEILTWFYLSGGNIFVFVGYIISWFISLIGDVLVWFFTAFIPAVAMWIGNVITNLINAIIPAWNLFTQALGAIFSTLLDVFITYIWNSSLIPVLAAIFGWFPLLTLGVLFFDLILAVWALFRMLALWIWENVLLGVNIPINFYYAFDTGLNETAFAFLLECRSGLEWWCYFLAGMQLINQVTAHSIVYPIVIVGIIIATILIFWRLVWSLATVDLA